MLLSIARERKRRELDSALAVARETLRPLKNRPVAGEDSLEGEETPFAARLR